MRVVVLAVESEHSSPSPNVIGASAITPTRWYEADAWARWWTVVLLETLQALAKLAKLLPRLVCHQRGAKQDALRKHLLFV